MSGRRREREVLSARCAQVWGCEPWRLLGGGRGDLRRQRTARRGGAALCALGTFLAVLGLVGAMGAGVAGSASVSPAVVEGNPSCADLGSPAGLKVEPPSSGEHTDGTLTVTVAIVDGEIDWTATLGVDAVIVKGGPVANVYAYAPASTGDDGLVAATNPATGEPYGISHVSFCYGTPTTTTTAPTSTTTAGATTTTAAETTTTTLGATTTSATVAATTTSTVGQQGGTTTTETAATTSPPVSTGGTSVTVQQTPTTAPGALPPTGSGAWPLFLVGAAMVGLGARVVAATRRAAPFDAS